MSFIRYADDFVTTAEDKINSRRTGIASSGNIPFRKRVAIGQEKTKITHINEGFDFLGQNVKKYNGKLLIKPSKKSIKAIKRKAFDIIKHCNGMPAEVLIYQLNPVLRGWANYHRFVVSKRVFSNIDSDIYVALWQWAKRRHSHNKNRHWIKQKYFTSIGNRNWVFSAKSGKKVVRLFLKWKVSLSKGSSR